MIIAIVAIELIGATGALVLLKIPFPMFKELPCISVDNLKNYKVEAINGSKFSKLSAKYTWCRFKSKHVY